MSLVPVSKTTTAVVNTAAQSERFTKLYSLMSQLFPREIVAIIMEYQMALPLAPSLSCRKLEVQKNEVIHGVSFNQKEDGSCEILAMIQTLNANKDALHCIPFTGCGEVLEALQARSTRNSLVLQLTRSHDHVALKHEIGGKDLRVAYSPIAKGQVKMATQFEIHRPVNVQYSFFRYDPLTNRLFYTANGQTDLQAISLTDGKVKNNFLTGTKDPILHAESISSTRFVAVTPHEGFLVDLATKDSVGAFGPIREGVICAATLNLSRTRLFMGIKGTPVVELYDLTVKLPGVRAKPLTTFPQTHTPVAVSAGDDSLAVVTNSDRPQVKMWDVHYESEVYSFVPFENLGETTFCAHERDYVGIITTYDGNSSNVRVWDLRANSTKPIFSTKSCHTIESDK